MLCIVVLYVYCASFHRYQQVQERCSSAAQVEHILIHSDGGQETELQAKLVRGGQRSVPIYCSIVILYLISNF